MWVRACDATAVLDAWTRALPVEVESSAMPTQAQADAWSAERTFGLIEPFALRVDALRIVLVGALATKVSWRRPFETIAADTSLGEGSPWGGRVERLLWDCPRDDEQE